MVRGTGGFFAKVIASVLLEFSVRKFALACSVEMLQQGVDNNDEQGRGTGLILVLPHD